MKVFKYVPFDNEVEFKQELKAFLNRFKLSSEPITDDRDKRIICAIAEKRGCPSMINFPWIRAE